MATTTRPSATSNPTTMLRAFQALAVLSVISVAFQFVTAGQLFPRGGPEEIHAGGAIALHVLTGLTAIAALLHQRASRAPLWPTILAAVVFVFSFVQAATGGRQTLYVHVPGAMILTVGAVWVLAWAFTGGARAGRS